MDPRRSIPGIDRLLGETVFVELAREAPRERIVGALQAVQSRLRSELAGAREIPSDITRPEWYAAAVRAELARWQAPSLVRVINATGVVLHTNLGRAPLAAAAIRAIAETAAGYSNLEYDLELGERGTRYGHCVELLSRLTGAEDALVVNNNAAAMVLALNTLALGREAIISRGELVEIGGAFRVPEIMARSGATMIEVGATNRTHERDYTAALSDRTGVIVKVHRSNFQVSGFVSEVGVSALAAVARNASVPLLYDLGSGLLLEPARAGLPVEPRAGEALAEGADLVAISGDKLLGGPQAGILLGRAELIRACHTNPLCRALRVDKLTIAALAATLALHADADVACREVPALRMLGLERDTLATRAAALAAALADAGVAADVMDEQSRVGGGALPEAALPTVVVQVRPRGTASQLERSLRAGKPPVIGRVQDELLLLDPRTVQPEEEAELVQAVIAAWRA